MSDGYDHPAARYRAMVFSGLDAMTAAKLSVSLAMDTLFGVRPYTTNEGWLVGGLEGNGEVNKEGPDASPAWRARIEKARREIEEISRESRVRLMADRICVDEIRNDLQEIRKWVDSLKRI